MNKQKQDVGLDVLEQVLQGLKYAKQLNKH